MCTCRTRVGTDASVAAFLVAIVALLPDAWAGAPRSNIGRSALRGAFNNRYVAPVVSPVARPVHFARYEVRARKLHRLLKQGTTLGELWPMYKAELEHPAAAALIEQLGGYDAIAGTVVRFPEHGEFELTQATSHVEKLRSVGEVTFDLNSREVVVGRGIVGNYKGSLADATLKGRHLR